MLRALGAEIVRTPTSARFDAPGKEDLILQLKISCYFVSLALLYFYEHSESSSTNSFGIFKYH